jgi:uncharacterized repeat protein (TIGR02543 family)
MRKMNEKLGEGRASIFLLLSLITFLVSVLTGCPNPASSNNGGGGGGDTYTVTFDSRGGSAVAPVTVADGATISAPASSKAGYNPGGWYKENTLTTPWVFASDVVTGNITLYAKWDEKAADVSSAAALVTADTFTLAAVPKTDSTTVSVTIQVEAGQVTVTVGGGTPITATGGNYVITDDAIILKGINDGAGGTTDVAIGYVINTDQTLTITGGLENLPGQDLAGGAVTSDTNSNLSAVTYTITYELDGGDNFGGAPATYAASSAAITLGTPTKTGYTFGGWYTTGGFSGSAVTGIAAGSTGDKTFYAKWTAIAGALMVTPNPVYVSKGLTQQFTATADGAPLAVTWELMGNEKDETTLSDAGLLSVADDETAADLVVLARSTADTAKYGTATVHIDEDVNGVLRVTVSPATTVVAAGITKQFTAAVDLVEGSDTAQTVTWSVSGNTAAGTAIDTGGLLTVAAGETASLLTVTATSTAAPSKKGTADATLVTTQGELPGLYKNAAILPVDLVIPPGSNLLAASLDYIKDNVANDDTFTILLGEDISNEPITFDRLTAGGTKQLAANNYNWTVVGAKTGVHIKLEGKDTERTISLIGTGALFTIGFKDNLTVTLGNNITLRGVAGNNEPLVSVGHDTILGATDSQVAGGKLVMTGNAKITGNINTVPNVGVAFPTDAGGVLITQAGIFEMQGGIITGNTGITAGGVVVGTSSAASTFIMSGGSISGNTGTTTGGVYVNNFGATFTKTGGTIYGGTASPALRNVANGAAAIKGNAVLQALSKGTVNGVSTVLSAKWINNDLTAALSDAGGIYIPDNLWSPQVTGVTVNTTTDPLEVAEGTTATIHFTATVAGSYGQPQTVTWKVNGASSSAKGSTISSAGVLSVSAAEVANANLTVTATSTFEPSFSGSKIVQITDPAAAEIESLHKAGEGFFDVSGETGATFLEKALAYVMGHDAGDYTIKLNPAPEASPLTMGAKTLNKANTKISLVGLGPGDTVIQLTGTGALFTVNNGTITLTLGNHIMCKGVAANTDPLIRVLSGTLEMLEGSTVTGNTLTTPNSNLAAGVSLSSGTCYFYMRGGVISNNQKGTPTGRATGYGAGAVVAGGASTFEMSGNAVISGNAAYIDSSSMYVGGGVLLQAANTVFSKTTTTSIIRGVAGDPADDNIGDNSASAKNQGNAIYWNRSDLDRRYVDTDVTGLLSTADPATGWLAKPRPAAPTASVSTVARTANPQASAAFTLVSPPAGTWKVWPDEDATTAVSGVTAALSGTTLTLTKTSSPANLLAGDYWVSVTETGQIESHRLKLTVGPYVSGRPDDGFSGLYVGASATRDTVWDDDTSLAGILEAIRGKASATDLYTIAVPAGITNSPAINLMSSTGVGTKLNIALKGKDSTSVIQLTGKGSLFTVNRTDQTLTLGQNITLKGVSDNTAALVLVSAKLVMEADASPGTGAKIIGNTSSGTGTYQAAGVTVSSYGSFEMHGGEISGNTKTGAGAQGAGGVVIAAGKTFVMTGGIITGNTYSGISANSAGGVLSAGSFTMSGTAAIKGNTRSSDGTYSAAGVHIYTGGSFTMSGGTISGNTHSGSGTPAAGGVLLYADTLPFTKTGGAIYGVNPGRAGYNAADDNKATGTGAKKGNAVIVGAGVKTVDGDVTGALSNASAEGWD